jgi:hypothetical protein
MSRDAPIEVLEQLIDLYPEALTIPSGYDKLSPFSLAIEEGVAMPKINLLFERGPDTLKMESSMGLPIHRIWLDGSPLKDSNIKEWNANGKL